jgi:hypothetical protein
MARTAYSFDDAKITPPLPNIKNANPQAIGECLARIAAGNGGRLKAELVEKDAVKNGKERHIIGRHLLWDNREAGRRYRCDQIRELVRVIQITDLDEPAERPKPAFLSVKDRAGVSYRTLGDVVGSSTLRLAVLQAAERELLSFEQRYHMLEEICGHIRTARSKAAQAKAQLESHA